MGLLSFDKPAKVRSTKEHNEMFSCEAAVGGYVSNMSKDDELKWKAKHITGDNERVEIRKLLNGVNIVIIVRKYPPMEYPQYKDIDWHDKAKWDEVTAQRKKWSEAQDEIKISMNGSLWLSYNDFVEIGMVIDEARKLLYQSFAF